MRAVDTTNGQLFIDMKTKVEGEDGLRASTRTQAPGAKSSFNEACVNRKNFLYQACTAINDTCGGGSSISVANIPQLLWEEKGHRAVTDSFSFACLTRADEDRSEHHDMSKTGPGDLQGISNGVAWHGVHVSVRILGLVWSKFAQSRHSRSKTLPWTGCAEPT